MVDNNIDNVKNDEEDRSPTVSNLLQDTIESSGINLPKTEEIIIPYKEDEEFDKETQTLNSHFAHQYHIYDKVLSPQLTQNENLKRKQKKILMNSIFKILKWQFIATYIFVFLLVLAVFLSNLLKISDTVIAEIIQFIQFYITSIVVELLAILFFIVKDVFDKSIFDLFKNFDGDARHKDNTK